VHVTGFCAETPPWAIGADSTGPQPRVWTDVCICAYVTHPIPGTPVCLCVLACIPFYSISIGNAKPAAGINQVCSIHSFTSVFINFKSKFELELRYVCSHSHASTATSRGRFHFRRHFIRPSIHCITLSLDFFFNSGQRSPGGIQFIQVNCYHTYVVHISRLVYLSPRLEHRRVDVRVPKKNRKPTSRMLAFAFDACSQLVPLELTSNGDGFQFSSSTTHRVKQASASFIHAMYSRMIATAWWSIVASRIDFACRPRDVRNVGAAESMRELEDVQAGRKVIVRGCGSH
jgi:hypothetical protein